MIVLLIVLAALAVLLHIPIGVRAQYADVLRIWLCVFFLRFPVYPAKPKNPKKPKKKKETPKDADSAPKRSLPSVRTLPNYASLAADLLGQFRRKIRIRELTIRATFGGADAGEAAIGYGRAWAAIGAVTPLLEQAFRIKKRNLSAEYDPDCREITLYACAHAELPPVVILRLAVRALAGWLKIRKENPEKKAVNEHDESDQ